MKIIPSAEWQVNICVLHIVASSWWLRGHWIPDNQSYRALYRLC